MRLPMLTTQQKQLRNLTAYVVFVLCESAFSTFTSAAEPSPAKTDQTKNDSTKTTVDNIFRRPALSEIAVRLMTEAADQIRKGDLSKADELLKRSVETAPFLAVAHYNLGCVQALRDQPEDAFRYLETAIEQGFSDTKQLEADRDLSSLRKDRRFASLVEKIKLANTRPTHNNVPTRDIVDGIALVGSANTSWDARTNLLQTHFRFPERSEPAPAIVLDHGKVGDKLRAWFAEGTAAGHAGVLYDNWDRDHSNLRYQQFPQLTRVEY